MHGMNLDAKASPPAAGLESAAAAPQRLRSMDELPGPRGWPLVGNMPQVRMARIHQDMERWSLKYGPLFRVRLGSTRLLVVADHDIVKALLRDRPDGLRRSSRLREVQRHLDIVLGGLYRRVMSPLPYWRWIRLPADRKLERSNAAVREAIKGFVAAARDRMRAHPTLQEHPSNLLEAMLAASDSGDAGVDDRDVAGNVSTMLFAGEDTTANTLAWLIWLLHRHPDALRRAQQEVREAVPDLAALTLEQVDALRYLDACASEAMRLKPVAPFLGIEALRDTTIADVRVPACTLVWCVMRNDSMDDRYFQNAAAFEPARWLGETGAAKRVVMPFGSGPRICPGRYLALLEIKLAMTMLLGKFEVIAVDTTDGGEARELMHFTMNPVGLRMRLRERPN
jgi:cytochrome P450